MPAFEYRSLDHRGKVKRGTLEADSARQIRQNGFESKALVKMSARFSPHLQALSSVLTSA